MILACMVPLHGASTHTNSHTYHHFTTRHPYKSFTPLICVICFNQWQIKLLATDCNSSGAAINPDFTDPPNPIVPVFAGSVPCFSTDQKKVKRLLFFLTEST